MLLNQFGVIILVLPFLYNKKNCIHPNNFLNKSRSLLDSLTGSSITAFLCETRFFNSSNAFASSTVLS